VKEYSYNNVITSGFTSLSVQKENCSHVLELNMKQIKNFQKKIRKLNLNKEEIFIAIINADDIHGKIIAKTLMPQVQSSEYQKIRNKGKTPFIQGIIKRKDFYKVLVVFDPEAAIKL
jgi:hypothetical protein